MGFLGWMALAGVVLLTMALASATLQRLPVSTAIVYLGVGIAVGPLGAGWLRLDVGHATAWFERLTEVAVIVALFIGGLKLRLPLRDPAWRASYLLAGPVMIATIALVALLAHFALGLEVWLALLVGALVAPTDPVLASAVAVENASDHDRVRYGLSAEAGLNDGTAFPFVVFALSFREEGGVGGWMVGWALHRLLWAVPAGLLIGYGMGRAVGRLAIWLRSRQKDLTAPSDFLALALIALSYVAAQVVGAWGFLAAFAAGVGLRHAEVKVVEQHPHPEAPPGAEAHPPAEDLVGQAVEPHHLEQPSVAAGVIVGEVLSFGETAERMLEVTLVAMVGIGLAVHWDGGALLLAAVLFVILRPLAGFVFLLGTPTSHAQRAIIGWFGIRGIGSLYYLAYAQRHGLTGPASERAAALVFSVVALSVVIHGLTAQPILRAYERRLSGGPAGRAPRIGPEVVRSRA